MSRARTGLAAGEAVLGLVIEQPDHGFGLERRLEQRFGSARFAYSTAYNALYRMAREGLVEIVDGESADARDAVYRATEQGLAHFREWVRSGGGAPVLREELHAKIALSEPRDLPRLIELVGQEELACVAELDAVRERVLAEQSGELRRPVSEREWSKLMALAVAHGEAAYWSGRIAQLGKLRAYLTELRDEAMRRTVAEDRLRHERRRRAG